MTTLAETRVFLPAPTAHCLPTGGLCKAGLITAVLLLLGVPQLSLPVRSSDVKPQACPGTEESTCAANPDIDLAIVLDRSGSMDPAERGEAFNIQVGGIAQALRDASVIPRDGSVSLSVMTFTDQATLRIPLTNIRSASVADTLAAQVDQLKCPGMEPCPARGPNPGTNFGPAISLASSQLSQDPNEQRKPRRVLMMSTDGGCTDLPDCGRAAATQFRSSASVAGLSSELDLVLIGAIGSADQAHAVGLVDGLPGAIFSIGPNSCTSGVGPCTAACLAKQVGAFAGLIRSVLRSHVQNLALEVTSSADVPVAPAAGSDALTLRQAIETANARGGETTITFNLKGGAAGNVIALDAPLPPICAPGIIIDGCPAPTTGSGDSGGSGDREQRCTPTITIDGKNTFCDGLLLRSNRAQILGLRIVNFNRAGITVAPLSPFDNVGFNRIEGNILENNSEAGVVVLDPPDDPAQAVFHNEHNTILGNNISGSRTPIDLGGDGPTPNDVCDADNGPNTLLNFPTIDSVAGTPGRAVITGSLSGSGPDCSVDLQTTVDVFAVATFDSFRAPPTDSARTATEGPQTDPRLITAVTFIGTATVGPDGSFRIEVGASPTCGYAVTATDSAGNTSEVSFPCQGFAKARIEPTSLDFPPALGGWSALTADLSVENGGCGNLTLVSATTTRVTDCKITDMDDSGHFSVSGLGGTVLPGQRRNLTVAFTPQIPPVLTRKQQKKAGGLPASALLPSSFGDTLTLNYDSGPASAVSLHADVDVIIRLIDPNNPQGNPLVRLTRSGDSFFVEFSIYDSDLDDIDHALIEFFGADGQQVPVDSGTVALRGAIAASGLCKGQSFTVVQEFSNAMQHAETASVTVTVSGTKSNTKSSASESLAPVGNAPSRSSELCHCRRRPQSRPLRRAVTRLKLTD
jgi:hypothetical protein